MKINPISRKIQPAKVVKESKKKSIYRFLPFASFRIFRGLKVSEFKTVKGKEIFYINPCLSR